MVFDEKEWTIMIYFASDNALAPEVVSQIKSIKQAGFHPEANVIAQFDPHTEGTPTHVFDINRINKLLADAEAKADDRKRNFKIGFVGRRHDDPFVVNVMPDKLWGTETDANGVLIRDLIRGSLAQRNINFQQPDPPTPTQTPAVCARNPHRPEEPSPKDSLNTFLQFCATEYPARHYILFILGHGVVVGNDIFLFDEHAARTSMTLGELGGVLRDFKGSIKKGTEFEMVGFHSCSLSSLEVASELKGTANFMLASQGPAYTGTWPYRQILIRIFKNLRNGTAFFNDPEEGKANVKRMLTKIFSYCLFNSFDFIVAGYTYDIALCNLGRLGGVRRSLSLLATELIKALNDPRPREQTLASERILLAHWDAQSFWKENYTDLFDFCFRLRRRCLSDEKDEKSRLLSDSLKDIFDRCGEVIAALTKETGTGEDRFIVRSEFAGASVQYSNGTSVYFPWSESLRDNFLKEYEGYRFISESKEFGEHSWLDFLTAYFGATRRSTRSDERPEQPLPQPALQAALLETFATTLFNVDGQLSKPGPGSSNGDGDDDTLSIKNYPPFTRTPRRGRGLTSVGTQGVSQNFLASIPDDDQDSQEEEPFLSEFP
ncbi:MAG TPA: clostripain-related cysteine peptidase [Pyrinomonadaceae bacterium]|jgi:hypothetical protein|nr:clostripain-related cysteine peptidase [Pyrinomonadaceae bacterium]